MPLHSFWRERLRPAHGAYRANAPHSTPAHLIAGRVEPNRLPARVQAVGDKVAEPWMAYKLGVRYGRIRSVSRGGGGP